MHRIVLLYGARKLYYCFKNIKKINVIQRILDLVQGLQFILKIYILRLPIKNFSISAKSIRRTECRRIVLHQTNTKSMNQFNHIIKESVGLDVE